MKRKTVKKKIKNLLPQEIGFGFLVEIPIWIHLEINKAMRAEVYKKNITHFLLERALQGTTAPFVPSAQSKILFLHIC